MKKVVSFLVLLAVVVSTLTAVLINVWASTDHTSYQTTQIAPHVAGFPYVQGTQLIDGSGKPFYLRGAEIESAFDNMGSWKAGLKLSHILNPTIFNAMVQTWKMNALRL